MSIEIEVSAFNNAEGKALEVGEYGAEVAKESQIKLLSMLKVLKKVKILLNLGRKQRATDRKRNTFC